MTIRLSGSNIQFPDNTTQSSSAVSLTLPTASSSRLGGVRIGNGIDINNGVISTSALPLVRGTPQIAITSGTSINFTNIPDTATRITVMISDISTTGTSPIQLQLGTYLGIEYSGYVGVTTVGQQSSFWIVSPLTTGFKFTDSTTALTTNLFYGSFTLNLIHGYEWTCTGNLAQTVATPRYSIITGNKTLPAPLDRIRLTTVNGTDSFDSGYMNIMYE